MRLVLAIVLTATTAHADGVYGSQMVGIGQADAPQIGKTIQTRAGVGARIDSLAIEAWVASDTAPERDGAMLGFVGGEPRIGSDLASYGVALRTIVPLHRTDTITVEGYTRIAAGVVAASGQLEGFGGSMLAAGGGLSLRGQVRALGFVWAPLFFLKRGPRVTGALFVDYGYERLDLARADRELLVKANHLVMGFAVGSAF